MKIKKSSLYEHIIKEMVQFNPIYYCLVNKESVSGLVHNERVLYLQESDYSVFYSKDIPTVPFSKSDKLPCGKIKLKITHAKLEKGKEGNSIIISSEK